MPDSDDEYIHSASDDDADAHVVSRGKSNRRQRGGRKSDEDGTAAGFEVSRTWENVVEGEDGTISGAVEGILEGGKRRRLLKDTTPLQRGIIRHLALILDMSVSMIDKDFRPTRHLLTIRYATEFVAEYFEQNPISQLAIIGMRDGLAVRVSDMSGNPAEHATALASWREQEPKGNPSLQNALEMARGALFHTPSHGTREVLLVFGALLSADPGDIHATIASLVKSRITCSVIGLSAEVAVCRTLVARTNPSLNPTSAYSVALHEQHYRELLMAATTPPATLAGSATERAFNSLLMMGFPSRTISEHPSLCACHSRPTRGGYLCSRCRSKVCGLPCTCPACGLTLILSTHLARSYHHLFPLQNWKDVKWARVVEREKEENQRGTGAESSQCFACLVAFPPVPDPDKEGASKEHRKQSEGATGGSKVSAAVAAAAERKKKKRSKAEEREGGISESGRYECGTCGRFFCIDCDLFAHEAVHNCPGCQSREGMLAARYGGADVEMAETQEGKANGATG